ncbi:DUF2891 family protein [Corynebacterium aurimucosum]|nr:DUF2891 family protein [Corynebacterium aurimucosum]
MCQRLGGNNCGRTRARIPRRDAPHKRFHRRLRRAPRKLHPSFYGCFNWHSSVHMQYSGTLLNEILGPESPKELSALLDDRLSTEALTTEYNYLLAHPGYEIPYGRAWLLQLAVIRPSEAMDKLVELTAQHCRDWLDSLNQPVRHGMHSNTAFNLFLILEAAEKLGLESLASSVREAAARLFWRRPQLPARMGAVWARFPVQRAIGSAAHVARAARLPTLVRRLSSPPRQSFGLSYTNP